jgi:methylthioribose-1-phosphate isomerase
VEHTIESAVAPLEWIGGARDGSLRMLEQRALPAEETFYSYQSADQVADAIRSMVVRGAPAIGISAAYGVVLGARSLLASGGPDALDTGADALLAQLAATRPTAVNLFWALDRMRPLLKADPSDQDRYLARLLDEAHAIMAEDRANNVTMALHGAALLPQGARVLTHCNTGGLATAGVGTALGVLRAAHKLGKLAHVWVDETRPYLQGARLTAWECLRDGLPASLITDNMAGHLMQRGHVDAVIVGADRIASNGDTANKIGTYSLAVLCHHHKIPFYVAAPLSTMDWTIADGSAIPIEERSADEVTQLSGKRIAPEGMPALHPAFDVTPHALISAIITERGVITSPSHDRLGGWRPTQLA